jgi:flagellar hook-basal body complex protein FliE
MENIFDYLPIIIAVLVFLVRLLSQKPTETTPSEQKPTNTPESGSFEDLLKQISKQINEAKEQANTTPQGNKKVQTQTSLTGQVIGKETGLTDAERNQDQHFQPYSIQNKSKKKKTTEVVELKSKYISESEAKEVFTGEKGLNLYEKVKEEQEEKNPYRKKVSKKNKFAVLFSNQDTLKNAFVMNELLSRKHF